MTGDSGGKVQQVQMNSARYELLILFAYKYPLRFKNVEVRSISQIFPTFFIKAQGWKRTGDSDQSKLMSLMC